MRLLAANYARRLAGHKKFLPFSLLPVPRLLITMGSERSLDNRVSRTTSSAHLEQAPC